MKQWFWSVFVTAIVGSVINAMGASLSNGIRKAVSTVMALCLLCAAALPLVSVKSQEFSKTFASETEPMTAKHAQTAFCRTLCEQMELAAADAIYEEFGINMGDVRIDMTIQTNGAKNEVVVERVCVLPGEMPKNEIGRLREFLETSLFAKGIVEIEESA